mgnify:CR=1 FL=1
MIDSYLNLINPSDTTNRMEKFSNLQNINEEFMTYLKREEQKYTNNNLLPEAHKRQEGELINKIYRGMQNNANNYPLFIFVSL